MLLLYGRHYFARHRAVADLVEPNSSVLELCCGPGKLYRRYLRNKTISYTGLDLNARFIKNLAKTGARGEVCDITTSKPLPESDYVIMQASLYHFLPDVSPILDRMMTAAKKALIMSEPVRNLADARLGLVRSLSARFANVGKRNEVLRFNEASLDDLFARLGYVPARTLFISGGREKVYLFRKT